MYYKVHAYVKKKIPNYERNFEDFATISDDQGTRLFYWNLQIPQPTKEQLDLITPEEIEEVKKIKKSNFQLLEDRISAIEDRISAIENSLILR